jgi:hypothetical protein
MYAAAPASLFSDEVTFFGDFEDGFGSVAGMYDSDVPYDPGLLAHPFHEKILGLSKFDPSLGILTDITIFVDAGSPIFYSLGGGMEVLEIDDSLPDYSASVSLFGEVLINYEGMSAATTVMGEVIPLFGAGTDSAGTGMFSTGIGTSADGSLTGAESVFGAVDFSDFVGLGPVDTLWVDMFVQETADFDVDNATATAGIGFDVFDSDSGADDAVIGITYTFTPVPEPGTTGLFFFALAVIATIRSRASRRPVLYKQRD